MIWNPWRRNAELEALVKVLRTKIDQLERAFDTTDDSRRRLELTNAMLRRDVEALKNHTRDLDIALKAATRIRDKNGRYLPKGQ